VVFFYFLIISYEASVTQSFVSLDEGSGKCEQVSRPFSGQYYASTDGYWSGASNFMNDNAMFAITFNDIRLNSNSEFEDFMNTMVKTAFLDDVGLAAKNATLASILMFWMNFAYAISLDEQVHTFGFAGSPVSVFNVDLQYAGMGNGLKTCNSTADRPSLSWNEFLAAARFTWDTEEYNCSDVLDPRYFGYEPQYDGPSFNYKLDHFSLTTAVAANFGLIDVTYLNNITNVRTFTFRGAVYSFDLMVRGESVP
jgi:hypothetical protein